MPFILPPSDPRLPLLASSTFLAVLGLTSTLLSPTYSAPHVYLVLCGSRSGYVFLLLFLTWVLHVVRFVCCTFGQAVQSARRIREDKKVASEGRGVLFRPLKSHTSGLELSGHSSRSEAGNDDDNCSAAVAPPPPPRLPVMRKLDEMQFGKTLMLDFAAVAVLYVTLCVLAWWAWSPPTFDPSALATESESLRFPSDFQFGASTSSYQVEGNLFHNQWAEFENDPDGRHIRRGQHCGAAANVWNLFESDLQERIIDDLHLDAFRLSVEWSRVEPERGHFNDTALDVYASWVSQLRDNGVEPVVTLHHFTNPLWFERMGGFESASAGDHIIPFVKKVVGKLGPFVDRWVTINEIMVYAGNGYLMGEFPPARKGEMGVMLHVVNNMLRTHELMYRTIKAAYPAAQVSIAKNAILYQPWSYLDLFAVVSARSSDVYYNAMPINVLRRQGSIDYLGLNTYIRMKVGPLGSSMGFIFPPEQRSDMGWDLDPQVLYQVVRQYHGYMPNLDIVITEHGVADGDKPDVRRVKFVRNSLLGLAQAVSWEGLPVVGYLHWSLLDNWEWSSGFDPKFGLYHIDLPNSQDRKLTEGGKLYKELIETRTVPV